MTLTERLVLLHVSAKRQALLAHLAKKRARHQASRDTAKAAVRETCKALKVEMKAEKETA